MGKIQTHLVLAFRADGTQEPLYLGSDKAAAEAKYAATAPTAEMPAVHLFKHLLPLRKKGNDRAVQSKDTAAEKPREIAKAKAAKDALPSDLRERAAVLRGTAGDATAYARRMANRASAAKDAGAVNAAELAAAAAALQAKAESVAKEAQAAELAARAEAKPRAAAEKAAAEKNKSESNP